MERHIVKLSKSFTVKQACETTKKQQVKLREGERSLRALLTSANRNHDGDGRKNLTKQLFGSARALYILIHLSVLCIA